jgi:hypothetical protein
VVHDCVKTFSGLQRDKKGMGGRVHRRPPKVVGIWQDVGI